MNKEQITVKQIKKFLNTVDKDFPIPLSNRQNLDDLAQKFYEKATFCVKIKNGEIISAMIGYTDNLIEDFAYLSVVATLPTERGNGYATVLLKEFIGICRDKKVRAIHLYTNKRAESLYRKQGFVDYVVVNETRPNDIHLVLYL